VSVNAIRGADYFQEDSDSMYYFDATSYVEYPDTAIKSGPVFVDPNYSLFNSRSAKGGDMTDSWSEASGIPYRPSSSAPKNSRK
jgi:hypothetical protein